MLNRLARRLKAVVRGAPSAAPVDPTGIPAVIGLMERVREESRASRNGKPETPRFGLRDVLAGMAPGSMAARPSSPAQPLVGGSGDAFTRYKAKPGVLLEAPPVEAAGRFSQRAATPRHVPSSAIDAVDPEFFARSAYAIVELTNFDGDTFLEVAYRCILKRPPDEHGLEIFGHRLARGDIDRIDVVRGLAASVEGRTRGVAVHGLAWLAFWRRVRRVPLVGPVVEAGHALLRLPRLARQVRALEAVSATGQASLRSDLTAAIADADAYRDEWDAHSAISQDRWDSLAASTADLRADLNAQRLSLSTALRRLAEDLAETVARLSRVEADHRAHAARLDTLDHRIDAFREIFAGQLETIRTTVAGRIDTLQATFADRVAAMDATITHRIDAAQADLGHRIDATHAALVAATDNLRRDAVRASDRMNVAESRFGGYDARFAAVEGKVAPIAAQHELEQFGSDDAASMEIFYDGLEARFRGASDEVRRRLEPYLAFVREAGAGTPDRPVIDLGCGRGEWLNLLKLNLLHAYGVDSSQVMVQRCRDQGLAAECADLLTYLRATASSSFGMVSAIHVVEHLSFKTLVLLVREILRVLKPGGLLLFETPNPENLYVAAYAFRMDPTHRSPLPPPMLEYLVESQGFESPVVLRLNAGAYGDPLADTPDERGADGTADVASAPGRIGLPEKLRTVVQQHLYAAPDYSVIARKPLAEASAPMAVSEQEAPA